MLRFVISKEQAREFAAACSEQIIKEIAKSEKQETELLNSPRQQESHTNAA